VVELAINTGVPMGRRVLTVLGMVDEMELGFIRDRQRAGIDAGKAKGICKGRRAIRQRSYFRAAQGRMGARRSLSDPLSRLSPPSGPTQVHQCLVAAFALEFARKKRIISRLASGPRASV
jgi:hypothetical protein